MFNKKIKIFHQKKFLTTSLSALFRNQKILLCSLIRPQEKICGEYIKYLYSLEETLKPNNIKIVLLTSQSYQIAMLDVYNNTKNFKELTCILDKELQIYNFLAKKFNKKQETSWLRKFWLFQILIENGKLLFFEEQPTENRLDEVKKNITREKIKEIAAHKKPSILISLKKYLSFTEETLYEQICLRSFNAASGIKKSFYVTEHGEKVTKHDYKDWFLNYEYDEKIISKILYYHNLWPNKKLNSFLKK